MIICGTIKLMNHHGLVIAQKTYSGRADREKIIDRWERKYATEKFWEGYALHILPYSCIYKVRKTDGVNIGVKKPTVKEAVDFARPPSEYTNIQSSYAKPLFNMIPR